MRRGVVVLTRLKEHLYWPLKGEIIKSYNNHDINTHSQSTYTNTVHTPKLEEATRQKNRRKRK